MLGVADQPFGDVIVGLFDAGMAGIELDVRVVDLQA
jgi:hypothetical protein